MGLETLVAHDILIKIYASTVGHTRAGLVPKFIRFNFHHERSQSEPQMSRCYTPVLNKFTKISRAPPRQSLGGREQSGRKDIGEAQSTGPQRNFLWGN